MKYLNIWQELTEDVIAILGDSFKVLLCLRLLKRSPELPTAATPEALFADVCETLVRDNFAKLKAFRTEKFGACHMTGDEVAAIAEALQPLCVRAWPMLNAMIAMNRDHLFQPRDYISCMGQVYYEEAASVTFVRFLNDMQRLQEIRSDTYERNVSELPKFMRFTVSRRSCRRNAIRAATGGLSPAKPSKPPNGPKFCRFGS